MSHKKIYIRFYEELNDFIPKALRKKSFAHVIHGTPSVKDVIESIGVPHTEVDLILVDNQSVSFKYKLMGDENVAVYPVFELLDISNVTRLRPKPLREPKFVLDVHLGKLARYLRMLGFDCIYRNPFDDKDIIELLKQDKRILLTRDIGLLKHKIVSHGYWLRETDPDKQTFEVIKYFDLGSLIQPFIYCMECNGKILKIDKSSVVNLLPKKTLAVFDDYYQCQNCHNIYWRGSHYDKMLKKVEYFSNG